MVRAYDVSGKLTQYKEEAEVEIKTSRQRRKKMEALTEEAQSAHKTGRYEVSFDKVVHRARTLRDHFCERAGARAGRSTREVLTEAPPFASRDARSSATSSP